MFRGLAGILWEFMLLYYSAVSATQELTVPLQQVYRVSTYIPPESVDRVVAAVCAIAPLRYGKYDHSAWWIAGGTEQYQPTPGSNPSHGEIGEISRVATTRLEFCLPRDPELLRRVIDAGLRPSHPWEQPAIFVEEVLADIRDA